MTGDVLEEYYPRPAIQEMPEWWKSLSPYFDGNKIKVTGVDNSNQTAKRCVPMLDAIGAGYTIVATQDIYIGPNIAGDPTASGRSGLGVDYHSNKQVETHPNFPKGHVPLKWNNPFSIKTPKGYSSLFVPVLNGDPTPFKFFSGVVDTDTYLNTINFPFELSPYDFDGVITAGTPLIQVIPFKRESWKIKNTSKVSEETKSSVRKFKVHAYGGYRKAFWQRKSYN